MVFGAPEVLFPIHHQFLLNGSLQQPCVIVIRTSSRRNCRTVNNSMVIQNGELDKRTRKMVAFYFPCRKNFFPFF